MVPEVHLTPVEVAAYVSAGTLAASKLMVACKPFWDRFPKWLSIALPVLVLDLPAVAQYFGGVTTGQGLFNAFVTSLALVLPGLAEARKKDEEPKKSEGDVTD